MDQARFEFLDKTDDIRNSFIASVRSGLRTKADLLTELAQKLAFPSYVGRNWDALADALCDLAWIERTVVILLHRDIPNLPAADLKTYVSVLEDAQRSWQPHGQHRLRVIFPSSARPLLLDAIPARS